jgi:hypothetical protein
MPKERGLNKKIKQDIYVDHHNLSTKDYFSLAISKIRSKDSPLYMVGAGLARTIR